MKKILKLYHNQNNILFGIVKRIESMKVHDFENEDGLKRESSKNNNIPDSETFTVKRVERKKERQKL